MTRAECDNEWMCKTLEISLDLRSPKSAYPKAGHRNILRQSVSFQGGIFLGELSPALRGA